MNLRDIVKALSNVTASGPTDVEVVSLTASSKEVVAGSLFAAIRGNAADGHQFIDDAIASGASVILAEKAPPNDLSESIAWLHVSDARSELASAASEFYGSPWSELKMVGVTGTNGKTTSAFLMHHVMKTVWHRAGLLGTIYVDDGEKLGSASHTTPGPVELSKILGNVRDNGCRGLVMEVSSHGIHQKRVSAIGFDACVFTNLTQDHLDYHGSLENYYQAKASWFESLALDPKGKKPVAVINVDDAHGLELATSLDVKGMSVIRFGFGINADFRVNGFRQNSRGMEFQLEAKGKSYLVRAPYIGRFNVYNLVAVLAAASACGIRPREAVAALADAPQIPGRMHNVGNAGGATVFVDYAHTPDALDNACRALKELDPRRLITVFGCGGDRDQGKRPLMAAAAARHSDAIVITSDNPRSEDPEAIIKEIEVGLKGKGHLSIPDRAEAIAHAVEHALSGDIILIAGKGHETYQQFKNHTVDFDDRKVASKALRDRAQTIAENR